MPKQNESPYVSHVFVCTNDRGGERKSCLPLHVSWQMIEKKTWYTAKIAEPGGSLDAYSVCGSDATRTLAVQVTLVVGRII